VDRWVEVDIDWFGDPPWDHSTVEFVRRVRPLLASADGLQGVCLNVGFLADIVTEWTGRPEQRLPLRSRRFARWAALTYEDLRAFLARLREAGGDEGLRLSLGILVAGLGEVVAPPVTGSMYDLFTHWYERHPELYPLDISPLPGPDLDPRVPMHADDYPYATRPQGISEAEPFPEFFGQQWGALASFLALDLIHLRDGFLGPLLYTRVGPYGTVASGDPEENRSWTDAVRRLFRACKEARPQSMVMAYSSGISGTAEWSVGCVDVEAVVADGALDIFIDQTWGGAWQDWWDDTWKGWTFQLAYLLGHGVAIRGANTRRHVPCRHYGLVETWDGWEPWDTLRDTPGKLEWGAWAFAHAAVIGPAGRPLVPDGMYVSWMNDWNGRLIGAPEVETLAHHLDAAAASAAAIEEVYGPLLVLDREGLLAKTAADPASNASEWVEDHAAMAMKWGAPILAATRPEWLPHGWPEGALWQLPGESSVPSARRLDGPLVVSGRADRVPAALLADAGIEPTGELRAGGYRLGRPTSPDLPLEERVHLPEHAPVSLAPGSWVGYDSADGPLLAGVWDVESEAAGPSTGPEPSEPGHRRRGGMIHGGRYHWQPPDLADPSNPLVPHSQIGTVSPYVEAARVLGRGAARAGGLHVEPVAVHEPVAVSCWRSGGALHVLLGNLESGWMGDARFPRHVRLRIPAARAGLDPAVPIVAVPVNVVEEPLPVPVDAAGVLHLDLTVGPAACLVVRLGTRT
jgi:hypothetical protein